MAARLAGGVGDIGNIGNFWPAVTVRRSRRLPSRSRRPSEVAAPSVRIKNRPHGLHNRFLSHRNHGPTRKPALG